MSKTPDELREELLKLAPVQYDDWYKANALTDTWNAIDMLEGLAIGTARLAAYLESRAHDQGHDTAVKNANLAVAKVRRALGYLIERNDIHF